MAVTISPAARNAVTWFLPSRATRIVHRPARQRRIRPQRSGPGCPRWPAAAPSARQGLPTCRTGRERRTPGGRGCRWQACWARCCSRPCRRRRRRATPRARLAGAGPGHAADARPAWPLGLAVAAVRKLREGYKVNGRVPAFVVFLLLESPGLVYAGILLGLIAGAYTLGVGTPGRGHAAVDHHGPGRRRPRPGLQHPAQRAQPADPPRPLPAAGRRCSAAAPWPGSANSTT